MTLADLAKESRLPARTIRFYIARNLLAGPLSAGRGAAYTSAHLERIKQIRAYQAEGLTLAEIACKLGGDAAQVELPAPATWLQYSLAPDVSVAIRGDVSPWRMRQIRAAIEQLAQQIREENSHG